MPAAPDSKPLPLLDNILIVDDDPGMIRIPDRILADYPARHFALSGAQALQQARADPPDLLLLDAQMPGMSGFEVCQVLKSVDAGARLALPQSL